MLRAYRHLFISLCASFVQAGPLLLPRNANGTHMLPAYGTARSLSRADAQPAYASTTSPCTTFSDSSTTYTAAASPPSFGMGSFPTVVDWSSLTVAHPTSGQEPSALLHFTYAPLRPSGIRSTAAATYTTTPCTDNTKSYDSTSTKTTFITQYTTVQPSQYSQARPDEEAPQFTNTADSEQSRPPAATSAPSSKTTSFVFFGEQPTTSAADNNPASARTFAVPYANTKPSLTSCSTTISKSTASQPPSSNAKPSTSQTFIYAPHPTTSSSPPRYAQTSQPTTAPDPAEATELPAIVTQQPTTTSSQPVGITIIPVNPYNLNPLPSSKKDSHQQQQDDSRATVTVTVTDAGATKTVSAQGSDCTDT